MNNTYIDIKRIAEIKGLKSTRSIRIAIQKGKYIAREVKVNGGTSYEILYSSLEPEIQERIFGRAMSSDSEQARKVSVGRYSADTPNNPRQKLEDDEIRSTALVPIDNQKPTIISESARMTSLARADIVTALENIRNKYKTKKEAEFVFLDLYNSGMLLPQVYKFIGKISIGTLRRWVKSFEEKGADGLVPQRRYSSITEYNTILNQEMKDIFLKFLLHPIAQKIY